jgi:ribonuclease P protein component
MPLPCFNKASLPSHTERFRPAQRLVRRADYLRIQERGWRVRTAHFVFMLMPCSGEPRFGVTATSKIGNAVKRNRIKRVAREIFRRNRLLFPAHSEIVWVARRGAYRLGYREALEELRGAQRFFTEYNRDRARFFAGIDGLASNARVTVSKPRAPAGAEQLFESAAMPDSEGHAPDISRADSDLATSGKD